MTLRADFTIDFGREVAREAPSKARRFVAEMLTSWQATSRMDDALLLTSELVTNAVLHGAPPGSLHITFADPVIGVEVRDAGPGRPIAEPFSNPTDMRGRGLRIVDALADRWGVALQEDGGKAVWFDLTLPAD